MPSSGSQTQSTFIRAWLPGWGERHSTQTSPHTAGALTGWGREGACARCSSQKATLNTDLKTGETELSPKHWAVRAGRLEMKPEPSASPGLLSSTVPGSQLPNDERGVQVPIGEESNDLMNKFLGMCGVFFNKNMPFCSMPKSSLETLKYFWLIS